MPAGGPTEAARWCRVLQLCLASLWLLDGVLQVQVFMFSRGFARSVAKAAQGNPAAVAGPVSWTGRLIGGHGALATVAIAIVEVLLGLGIAWRPTLRLALAASIAWALGVWWLGEGLGGLLTPAANPVTGAPGAVIIYAMLAVVLWPAGRGSARGAGDSPVARVLWLLLWGGMCVLCLRLAIWSPGARDSVNAMADGQPKWLATSGSVIGAALARHGFAACLALAGGFAVSAAAVFLPVAGRRAALVLAAVLGVLLWSAGQDFGGIFTGMATDPNSGPLLVLAAAAYWPLARPDAAAGRVPAAELQASAPIRVRRDIDVMNAAMALAMAMMLAGWLSALFAAVWTAAFAAAAAWFAGHAYWGWRRREALGQHVTHLLSCGGMLVMLAAPNARGGSMGAAGGTSGRAVIMTVLAAAFAAALAGCAVVVTDRLTGQLAVPAGPYLRTGPDLPGRSSTPAPGGGAGSVGPAAGCPRLRLSCQAAMGLAMACMLIQML